jgi:ABC-type lipoprotein release transport system permease subunit
MRSYLSLIPISAKAHRRQNRMTILCIAISVFLVTAIFSMADMGVRQELNRLAGKHTAAELSALRQGAAGHVIYLTAAVLFVLVLVAGVLMISGSISSNVAQRTKFFGMMRCIGMSRRQIIRFVKLEALNWCKTAIPIGLALGVAATWALCAALHFVVGEEFSNMPLWGVSLSGLLSGTTVGIVTVLLAAGAPARKAAGVSPAAAVSGNADAVHSFPHGANLRFARVDTALGIRHALSAKKNFVLVTGSFALSIVLFLCFSVMVQLVDHLMPQSSARADLVITAADSSAPNSIDQAVLDEISGMDGVKRAFGRSSSLGVPAALPVQAKTADLISYADYDLDCLAKDRQLKTGSHIEKVYGDSRYVLAVWDHTAPLAIGDTIRAGGEELTIAGLLKADPFRENGDPEGTVTLLSSAETFARLTGITGYSLITVQLAADASEENVEAIRALTEGRYLFSDQRSQKTSSTYLAFLLFVYGFLVVIALVTVLNIVNSISMSVSARAKQYAIMRAVGMDGRQLTKMIAAQTLTYALSGCAAGCILGLPLSRFLYDALILRHFPNAVWNFPVGSLLTILLFVLGSAFAAICAPSGRIRKMTVMEVIAER